MYYLFLFGFVVVAVTVILRRHLERKYEEWPIDNTF